MKENNNIEQTVFMSKDSLNEKLDNKVEGDSSTTTTTEANSKGKYKDVVDSGVHKSKESLSNGKESAKGFIDRLIDKYLDYTNDPKTVEKKRKSREKRTKLKEQIVITTKTYSKRFSDAVISSGRYLKSLLLTTLSLIKRGVNFLVEKTSIVCTNAYEKIKHTSYYEKFKDSKLYSKIDEIENKPRKTSIVCGVAVGILLTYSIVTLLSKDEFEIGINSNRPDIVAEYAIALDVDTKEILYGKNHDTITYPASLTKLMTGLLLAENVSKNDLLTYSEKAYGQDSLSYGVDLGGISVGDTMSAQTAMDIMMLYSANDIAYMVAEHVGDGDAIEFIHMMDARAEEIGMNSTNFMTPSGLDAHTDRHVSTAYDMGLLLCEAYDNSFVRESMSKSEATVKSTNGATISLENSNHSLGTNGNIAGKTGYTAKAGRCIAGVYDINGREVAIIILASTFEDAMDDMNQIASYIEDVKKEVVLSKGSILGSELFEYKSFPIFGKEQMGEAVFTLSDSIALYEPNAEWEYEINIHKLSKNSGKATLVLTQGEYTQEYPLNVEIRPMN